MIASCSFCQSETDGRGLVVAVFSPHLSASSSFWLHMDVSFIYLHLIYYHNTFASLSVIILFVNML